MRDVKSIKRPLALLAIVTCLVSSAHAQPQTDAPKAVKSDKEEYGLTGPVETLRSEWAYLSDKPNDKGQYTERELNYVETVTFDKDGRAILQDPPPRVCLGGTSEGRNQNASYDEKGNLIEERYFDYQCAYAGKSTFKCDEAGRRIEAAYSGPRGVIWVKKYDAKGREIEQDSYDEAGRLEEKAIYALDEAGNVTEKRTYNREAALKEKRITTYKYDEHGNWIQGMDRQCNVSNDKLACKPTRIDYRFITYYSEAGGELPARRNQL